MSINTGQLAPTFETQTYDGAPISLEQYRGKKVWLGFYRYAGCPLCNLRISEMVDRAAEFERDGIQVICVFHSPADRIAGGVGKQSAPFPIIADPTMSLYQTYGVSRSLAGMFYPRVMLRSVTAVFRGFFSLRMDGPIDMVPADFLVDPEGMVYQAYYGKAVSDHIPFADIATFGKDLCLDMPAAPPAV